jgi:ribosome biogenesis GTPase
MHRTPGEPVTVGVVLSRTGSTYRVYTDRGEVTATLRGRLKHQDGDRVVAGDVVELDVPAEAGGTGGTGGTGGRATISGVRRRRSVLARRAAGERRPRRQPIAANVDQVLVVAAARDPEPNPRLLDRFLVIAEANRLPCVVILNKIELDRSALERLARRYGAAGYQVVATSVKQPEGLMALRDLLRGRESVLAGESGVGKSSLLNALYPGLNLRIGEISEKWGAGRHTTRAALLIPLPAGRTGAPGEVGYVVDTPGLREVGTWGIDPEVLGTCFPEFRRFLDQCRFDNCRHLAEPGCAVREAAEAGTFDADRLLSYRHIHEEVSVPSWSSVRRRAR